MTEIDDAERRRRIAVRHLLAPPHRSSSPTAIANSLVALHASDPVTVYLSVTARQSTPSLDSVADALYVDRTLLRHHAMRRTLWVMPIDTAVDAHASSTRKIASAERRRTVKGSVWTEESIDGAIGTILDGLSEHGAATTRQIGAIRPELAARVTLGTNTRNPAQIAGHARLLLLAGFEGVVARGRPSGSWISSEYEWWRMSDWLGHSIDTANERPAAAALLARWLRAFGPGTETDLRWWTGWTATSVRRALEDVGAEQVQLEEGVGWVCAGDTEQTPDSAPWVALLPGLDPTSMGWKERVWYLSPAVQSRVVDRNGNIGPTLWVNGRIVGGWAQRPDGTIVIDEIEPLTSEEHQLVDTEIGRLSETVGETRFRVRFPSPNQGALLA